MCRQLHIFPAYFFCQQISEQQAASVFSIGCSRSVMCWLQERCAALKGEAFQMGRQQAVNDTRQVEQPGAWWWPSMLISFLSKPLLVQGSTLQQPALCLGHGFNAMLACMRRVM
jgi:hypothetical protein